MTLVNTDERIVVNKNNSIFKKIKRILCNHSFFPELNYDLRKKKFVCKKCGKVVYIRSY